MTAARPHAQHAPRGAPEKAVVRDITRFLHALGYVVNDMSQPRASMMPVGLPDLYAMHRGYPGHPGHAIWVEAKAARGRVSEAQQAWHAAARAAGQTVLVARSAADLIPLLRSLGAPLTPDP